MHAILYYAHRPTPPGILAKSLIIISLQASGKQTFSPVSNNTLSLTRDHFIYDQPPAGWLILLARDFYAACLAQPCRESFLHGNKYA